jgi:threonine dehydrogenase-like Zn-dependent dehydrogenase
MATMKAAMFRGNGVLNIEEVPVPEIKNPDEVLIRVRAGSICGSDLHSLSVPPLQVITPDIIFGHEFFGDIVAKGDGAADFEIGDTVVVNPNITCGECYECKHKRPCLCKHNRHYGQSIDGGFAQYALVHTGQLYKVSKDINPDRAAQTEPLACIMDGLNKIMPDPDDNVLLFGAGPIGLTFIRVLKYMGIKNLAVSAKGAVRIEEAINSGADHVINIEKESVSEALPKIWERKADVIIDAVGTGDILTESMDLLAPGGKILIFGYNQRAKATVLPGRICDQEFVVVGTIGKDFESALKIVDDPKLGLDKLVTRRVELEGIHDAVDQLRAKKACRIIVYPNGIE